jgi:hypothetical protein
MALKEDDELIALFLQYTKDCGAISAAEHMERLLRDHRAEPTGSELKRLCPHARTVHKELAIRAALQELDSMTHLLKRKHVGPTFSEIRQTLNLSVVHACAESVNLVTLDADDTCTCTTMWRVNGD